MGVSLGGGMFGIVTVNLSLGPHPLMGIVPTPNFLRTPALNPTVISRPFSMKLSQQLSCAGTLLLSPESQHSWSLTLVCHLITY